MVKSSSFIVAALVITAVVASSKEACSQEYVVMGTPMVNIRTGPSTEHVVVGRAEKGDIFRVAATDGDWIEIEMFTKDRRYVFSASYVYPLTSADLVPGHRMALSDSARVLRRAYQDIMAAKTRAQREASEIIPETANAERHAYLRRIIEDRVILETMHIHGIQPALYVDLMEHAQEAKW